MAFLCRLFHPVSGSPNAATDTASLSTLIFGLWLPPLAGAWLLTFGGTARREMDEAEAAEVLAALDSLEQAMLTQSDPLTGFADLLSRTPELPEHLKK